MSTARWSVTVTMVAGLLAGGSPGPAVALDAWVLVAAGGLGDPARKQVDALAIFGDHVYLATHRADAVLDPVVLRAEIATDTVWVDATPPGLSPFGEVTDLRVVEDTLYLGTSRGELQRRLTRSPWSVVDTPWGSGDAILALGEWAGGGLAPRLCALIRPVQVWCLAGGEWEALPPTPVAEPGSVASGRLASLRGELFVGLGGLSAGSRGCEAWRFGPRGGWRPVTTDCFGGWDEATDDGLTWLADLAAFEGRMYFGTGGHLGTPVLARLDRAGIEDVTPLDLFECHFLGGRCPVRYNRLAVSGGRIYVGTRTGGLGNLTDLLVSDDGASWRSSAESGFGVASNDTVSALAGRDAYLYAGALNPAEGFQVWRRTPRLIELGPPLLRHLWEVQRLHGVVLGCIRPPLPCPPPWERLYEPIGSIRVALAAATHGGDDQAAIKEARGAMAGVPILISQAENLVAAANKAVDDGQARELRRQAALTLRLAWVGTRDTVTGLLAVTGLTDDTRWRPGQAGKSPPGTDVGRRPIGVP